MKYSEQLQQPEWKAKRIEILNRDGNCCTSCGCNKGLHVHHKKYIKGKQPWEVPNSYLITLCHKCHMDVHKGKSINDFIQKKPKKKQSKKPVKKKKSLLDGLSSEQKRIQARYDKLKKN